MLHVIFIYPIPHMCTRLYMSKCKMCLRNLVRVSLSDKGWKSFLLLKACNDFFVIVVTAIRSQRKYNCQMFGV